MFGTTIGGFIGGVLGAITGNILYKRFINKQPISIIELMTDIDNPNFFQEIHGEDGIKWDKLWERSKNVQGQLSLDDRWEFLGEMINATTFREKFDVVSKYENKLKNKEK